MKNILLILTLIIFNTVFIKYSHSDIYDKIDIFSEVLDKINKDYVEEINQNDAMDAAINGVFIVTRSIFSIYVSRGF